MEEKPLEINIKICRMCGSSENKFEAKRRKCNKCMSKQRYDLNQKNNYFNKYYHAHKETILKSQHDYYIRKTTPVEIPV
jgi:hypothetical protein